MQNEQQQMKEPKLNQEKLEMPNDSRMNKEINNQKEEQKEEEKEEEKEIEKEDKEENPQENESKEVEEESKEKEEKEEQTEKKEEKEEESQENNEDEIKDLEGEPKDFAEEHKETKEDKEEMNEEQPQPIIKVEERENQDNNEEQNEEQEQNDEQEQNEEMQDEEGMKTPTKGKMYRFIQNGQLLQVDNKGQVYKVIQQSHKSSIENQGINESYELNQEKINNNIIYHDIAFRSSQKGNNNNNEITTEKIKQQRSSNIVKRKEPKDSNPKVHIISKKKGFKKFNEKAKINGELIDLPRNEIGNKEYSMVIGDGMETGEYKFIGEKTLIKENIVPNENVMITQEEIAAELSKRKNKKKGKKIKYEVIDKFYALTNISVRTIKKLEKNASKGEQRHYFYSTLNINNNINTTNFNTGNINNTNINNTFSGMNSQFNNYMSYGNINTSSQKRAQNMNMNMNMMNIPSMQMQNMMTNMNMNMNISMPIDNYSRYFLSQVNKIRTEPQSFIGVIEDSKANIIKDRQGRIIYNGKIKVALNKGEAAFDEAIEFLKELNPLQPLAYNQMITINAPVSENEILDKDDLINKITAIVKSGVNIKSYWRDVIKDPEISFLLMIIDDNGIKSGMRRKDILSPYMKYIGVSSAEINKNFVCYVTLA